jgi:hypothetical protein
MIDIDTSDEEVPGFLQAPTSGHSQTSEATSNSSELQYL